MSSALEVEFVLRSLMPLSEPKVTLISVFSKILSKQSGSLLVTLICYQASLLSVQTLDCSHVSPCLSSLLRLCYYNDFVIIKCPRPGSCHDASCLIFLSQQSSVKQFTRLFIVYNTQTINGLCTMNSKKMKK